MSEGGWGAAALGAAANAVRNVVFGRDGGEEFRADAEAAGQPEEIGEIANTAMLQQYLGFSKDFRKVGKIDVRAVAMEVGRNSRAIYGDKKYAGYIESLFGCTLERQGTTIKWTFRNVENSFENPDRIDRLDHPSILGTDVMQPLRRDFFEAIKATFAMDSAFMQRAQSIPPLREFIHNMFIYDNDGKPNGLYTGDAAQGLNKFIGLLQFGYTATGMSPSEFLAMIVNPSHSVLEHQEVLQNVMTHMALHKGGAASDWLTAGIVDHIDGGQRGATLREIWQAKTNNNDAATEEAMRNLKTAIERLNKRLNVDKLPTDLRPGAVYSVSRSLLGDAILRAANTIYKPPDITAAGEVLQDINGAVKAWNEVSDTTVFKAKMEVITKPIQPPGGRGVYYVFEVLLKTDGIGQETISYGNGATKLNLQPWQRMLFGSLPGDVQQSYIKFAAEIDPTWSTVEPVRTGFKVFNEFLRPVYAERNLVPTPDVALLWTADTALDVKFGEKLTRASPKGPFMEMRRMLFRDLQVWLGVKAADLTADVLTDLEKRTDMTNWALSRRISRNGIMLGIGVIGFITSLSLKKTVSAANWFLKVMTSGWWAAAFFVLMSGTGARIFQDVMVWDHPEWMVENPTYNRSFLSYLREVLLRDADTRVRRQFMQSFNPEVWSSWSYRANRLFAENARQIIVTLTSIAFVAGAVSAIHKKHPAPTISSAGSSPINQVPALSPALISVITYLEGAPYQCVVPISTENVAFKEAILDYVDSYKGMTFSSQALDDIAQYLGYTPPIDVSDTPTVDMHDNIAMDLKYSLVLSHTLTGKFTENPTWKTYDTTQPPSDKNGVFARWESVPIPVRTTEGGDGFIAFSGLAGLTCVDSRDPLHMPIACDSAINIEYTSDRTQGVLVLTCVAWPQPDQTAMFKTVGTVMYTCFHRTNGESQFMWFPLTMDSTSLAANLTEVLPPDIVSVHDPRLDTNLLTTIGTRTQPVSST